MEKFVRVSGPVAPLLRDNIDTDAIIPVPWLKRHDADLGEGLFGRWRYLEGGGDKLAPNPEFVLNREPFTKACILVAGRNFGCGSSREHAVWALMKFGIRAVIAESFGDIFYNNCFNNGLLPVRLAAPELKALSKVVVEDDGRHAMTVDLERQSLTAPNGMSLSFDLDPARRQALLEGLDVIGMTLKHDAAITAFQRRDRLDRSWMYPP
jgi:3-isopropylmalate/(R)-2-methylmalate dehydratase small subunit